jgi:WD40 repeat protein
VFSQTVLLANATQVWDIASRTIKQRFIGHKQDIYSLEFARNGRIIASGSGDRSVRLWDLETNQQILHLAIEDGVTSVAISPDSHFVAAGSLDNSVRVWDVRSGNLVAHLEGEQGHKESVFSVAFAPSGDYLFSGSLDETAKMWELKPPSPLIPGATPSGKCIQTFEGHTVSFLHFESTSANGFLRTLLLVLRVRLTATGSSVAQKTRVFSSGIPILVSPNLGCKATRTQVL